MGKIVRRPARALARAFEDMENVGRKPAGNFWLVPAVLHVLDGSFAAGAHLGICV